MRIQMGVYGMTELKRMSKHCTRVIAADIWAGFSGAFKSVVRVISLVMPEEFAWGLIYLFLWMGLVGAVLWVGNI